MNSPKIERALVSVSDKTGLVEFSQGLAAAGVKLYASGGTRRHLEQAGLQVIEVAAYTGFPEMMDGRLKTLHPKIHGGILCRRDNPDDMAALKQHGVVPFELVVVNLYPFAETIAKPGVTSEEAIENIDIGGPTLIRAAAKNHAFVTIACNPSQYGRILEEVRENGTTTPELRRQLAAHAYFHTGLYDVAIADWFDETIRMDIGARDIRVDAARVQFPSFGAIRFARSAVLRYGENPHQAAALYEWAYAPPHSLVHAKRLHGKELSYNNLLDLNTRPGRCALSSDAGRRRAEA